MDDDYVATPVPCKHNPFVPQILPHLLWDGFTPHESGNRSAGFHRIFSCCLSSCSVQDSPPPARFSNQEPHTIVTSPSHCPYIKSLRCDVLSQHKDKHRFLSSHWNDLCSNPCGLFAELGTSPPGSWDILWFTRLGLTHEERTLAWFSATLAIHKSQEIRKY